MNTIYHQNSEKEYYAKKNSFKATEGMICSRNETIVKDGKMQYQRFSFVSSKQIIQTEMGSRMFGFCNEIIQTPSTIATLH